MLRAMGSTIYRETMVRGGGSLREPYSRDLVEEIRVMAESGASGVTDATPRPAYRVSRLAATLLRLLGEA